MKKILLFLAGFLISFVLLQLLPDNTPIYINFLWAALVLVIFLATEKLLKKN